MSASDEKKGRPKAAKNKDSLSFIEKSTIRENNV